MRDVLESIGNVPVTTSVLASLYPNVKNITPKLSCLEREGQLIHLKSGLYVASPEASRVPLSTELIANHIYAPSFVSLSTALRYYGLIPELVYLTQSVTIKRSRSFSTPIGQFDYKQVSRESFSVGVRCEQRDNFSFLIATPERALCDLIAATPNLELRYMCEAAVYLEEDIRLDMDAFRQMDKQQFIDYINVGKKSNSIRTILKLLQQ